MGYQRYLLPCYPIATFDHSKAVKEVMRASIDVYTSQGTIDALKLSGHRIHAIVANKQYKIGEWVILPIKAIHDAPETLSFLMANHIGEKLLFCTDTAYIMNRFVGLSIIAIECNYQEDILQDNINNGIVEYGMKKRLLETHMSLQQTIGFLEANDLSKVQEIHLIHLSGRNSDAEEMRDAVIRETGKMVYC